MPLNSNESRNMIGNGSKAIELEYSAFGILD
jgi:hypothetical protein